MPSSFTRFGSVWAAVCRWFLVAGIFVAGATPGRANDGDVRSEAAEKDAVAADGTAGDEVTADASETTPTAVRPPTRRRIVLQGLTKAIAKEAPAEDAGAATAVPETVSAVPTHHQVTTIQANVEGQPEVALQCFWLTPDDRILAGCVAGESGEIRVFDVDGKYVDSWPTPVKPEAIFVRGDGKVFLAGEGQLVQLSSTGGVELQREAPHASAINESRDQIRQEVVDQAKQMANMYGDQVKAYDDIIERTENEIAKLKEQIAEESKPQLERRLAMQEQMKKQYIDAREQFAKIMGENPSEELTEEQIEEKIKASMAYKLKASSISATDAEVFLASHAAVGYGFTIWRMDNQFENGKQIVSDLSGCCGQMDVKANADGLFVAENSKHRVCRYDRDGKLICTWGESARTGLDGFGSCCNPMNVAFGPGGEVYTAEDNTGRIKRYSVDGKLLGLVGSIEVVPGCKNVSIAVNGDGNRVYMMDLTRNQIGQLEPYKPGEAPAAAAEAPGEGAQSSASPGSAVVEGVKTLFSLFE